MSGEHDDVCSQSRNLIHHSVLWLCELLSDLALSTPMFVTVSQSCTVCRLITYNIFIIANTTAGNVKSITCVNLNVIFLLQSANINTALHLCRLFSICSAFSALTLLVRCQEEHLACTNWLMRCWCDYLSAARCRLFAYGPANATAIPSHHVLPH